MNFSPEEKSNQLILQSKLLVESDDRAAAVRLWILINSPGLTKQCIAQNAELKFGFKLLDSKFALESLALKIWSQSLKLKFRASRHDPDAELLSNFSNFPNCNQLCGHSSWSPLATFLVNAADRLFSMLDHGTISSSLLALLGYLILPIEYQQILSTHNYGKSAGHQSSAQWPISALRVGVGFETFLKLFRTKTLNNHRNLISPGRSADCFFGPTTFSRYALVMVAFWSTLVLAEVRIVH